MGSKTVRTILAFLMGFLSIGALGGGMTFILSPSGALMGMPVSQLEGSPFNDFLVPGLFLFTVLGVLPAVLAWALVKKPACRAAEAINFFSDLHWTWSFTVYTAFGLVIWILVEVSVIRILHWLQAFYLVYAVVILFFALLPGARHFYRKVETDIKEGL